MSTATLTTAGTPMYVTEWPSWALFRGFGPSCYVLFGSRCLPLLHPEGPSTRYLSYLIPKAIPLMAFGTRVLTHWVLGPFWDPEFPKQLTRPSRRPRQGPEPGRPGLQPHRGPWSTWTWEVLTIQPSWSR